MRDDVSDIAEYYNNDADHEHSRLDRHQLEYDLTWCYLNRYLPARGSILEIGAGSGRYTLELARRGYAVTAVDLSAALIERSRKTVTDQGLGRLVRFVIGDVRDLGTVTATPFDAVLLMGPLYHLVVESDRRMAIKQACNRLHAGGVLFSAMLSRYGIIGDMLKKYPNWIEDVRNARALLDTGRRPDDYPPGGFRGYFCRVDEIVPLHEASGFQTLTVAGVDPSISADDESYNRLSGKQRQLWLDLLFEISSERSIVAASRHILYIGKKT